jgi:dihydroorotase
MSVLQTSAEWIDLHAHVEGLARFGVDPTKFGVGQGVGVLVDAGSAPPAELGKRLSLVQGTTPTTVLAWANICAEGIAGDGCATHDISGAAARIALKQTPGRVVGIKLQASATRLAGRGLAALEIAKSVAVEFGVPLMVHVGNGPPTMREVAEALRTGDIVTHFAHGKPAGALDGEGVHRSLRAARERGVLFDIGHGAGSFSFEVMEALMRHGFPPDIISTDLHRASLEAPVRSLADCMSKMLGLEMAENEVIAAVTDTPRKALKLPEATRTTSYAVQNEEWIATDSYGGTRTFSRRFRPRPIERKGN